MKIFPLRKPVLAVQWDAATVDYVLAEQKSGRVSILAAASVARAGEEEDAVRSPSEVLRAELGPYGIRRLDTLVALGRSAVDVIPLQLPPAGDAELPTLVANQVVRDAGDVAESGIVDFVPLYTPEAETGERTRDVFAFVVEAHTMQHVLGELGAAGLKPCAATYRPLASLTLLRRLVPQSQRTMILITLHDREADISIVRHADLVYTRTARLGETKNIGDIAAQVAVEVRRSLAAASLTTDAEEQHLYVFGSLAETERMVEEVAEELSLPASLLDPLRNEQVEGPIPDRVGRLAPLLGMVHEHFAQKHPLDFLHPKQPPPPPNYYRRGAFYAAALIALVACGAYYVWEQNALAAEEIASLRANLQKTNARLEKVKEKEAVVDAIWQWSSDNVNWLDELYDLTSRFPNGNDALIRRLSVSPGRGGRNVIDLAVQVRDPEVITQMDDSLRDELHDVRSTGVSEGTSSKDYPWQFETRITLQRREVDEYRKTPPAERPKGDIASRLMVTAEDE